MDIELSPGCQYDALMVSIDGIEYDALVVKYMDSKYDALMVNMTVSL